MNDGFYRAFEDRHRGSRELIKRRLGAYFIFTQPLCEQYPASPALDLGCGRGEWLEVLGSWGLNPVGIDMDEGMLSACHDQGLSVHKGDAIEYLSTVASNSQAVVSAFHFVEHISFDQLRMLVSETLRVLKPGGLLIMETPNPENIVVATRNFYLDPTHNRPIPPELLEFVPEYYGFKRVKTIRLQESKELAQSETLTLQDVFHGVSPDYAIVAQKDADPALMAFTMEGFSREYGITLEDLSNKYDNSIKAKIWQADAKAQQADAKAQQADAKAQQAEIVSLNWQQQAYQGNERISVIYASTSWKITKPLRTIKRALTGDFSFFRRVFSAVKLKTKKISLGVVSASVAYVYKHPALVNRLKKLIMRVPSLRQRLIRVAMIAGTQGGGYSHLRVDNPLQRAASRELQAMSPRANHIYINLKSAIEKNREGRA